MTPLDERALTIYVQESVAATWPDSVAAAVFGLFDPNPWRPFTEMRKTVDDDWQSYQRDASAAIFDSARELSLRASIAPLFDGSLSCSKRGSALRITMQLADYEARGPEAVEAWIAAAWAALPNPSSARAKADDDQMVFMRKRKVPTVPDPFGEIGWLHVAHPDAYRDKWDRDVLLGAPCLRVEERADGAIWLWVYEHPFHYDTPVARDTNAALRLYLREHERRP